MVQFFMPRGRRWPAAGKGRFWVGGEGGGERVSGAGRRDAEGPHAFWSLQRLDPMQHKRERERERERERVKGMCGRCIRRPPARKRGEPAKPPDRGCGPLMKRRPHNARRASGGGQSAGGIKKGHACSGKKRRGNKRESGKKRWGNKRECGKKRWGNKRERSGDFQRARCARGGMEASGRPLSIYM